MYAVLIFLSYAEDDQHNITIVTLFLLTVVFLHLHYISLIHEIILGKMEYGISHLIK